MNPLLTRSTLLLACALKTIASFANPDIDDSFTGANHRDRCGAKPKIFILQSFGYSDEWPHHHFSKAGGTEGVVNGVTEKSCGVAPHYMVSQESKKIWQYAPENRAAYHAGVSDWHGWNVAHSTEGNVVNGLNEYSIGVEFQCPGYMLPYGVSGKPNNPNAPHFYPTEDSPFSLFHFPEFDPTVLDMSIALSVDIVNRWKIAGEYVLPHSSISPGRKTDPGPYFPYEDFAKAGVGVWASTDREGDSSLDISLAHVQELLKTWGYHGVEVTCHFDDGTKKALQSHYLHHLGRNVPWVNFLDVTSTIFNDIERWVDMPYDKEKLVINLENLVAGNYMYQPLYSVRDEKI